MTIKTAPAACHQNADGRSEMETVHRCPVCGGGRFGVLYNQLEDKAFGFPGRWSMVKCKDCGSAYANPRFTSEAIGRAYAAYYTHESSRESEPVPDAGWGLFRRALRYGYLNAEFGCKYEPAAKLGKFVMRFCPRLRLRLDREMRHLRLRNEMARLLDVGCGNGDFLIAMRARGWAPYGVEPDARAAKAGLDAGIPIKIGVLESDAFPEAYFDAITLNHVIEHLHSPIEVLKTCFKILKPGGVIWLSTPNLVSLSHWVYKCNWRGLEPPRHLVLFDPSALKRSLETVGFSAVEFKRIPCEHAEYFYGSSRAIARGEDPNTSTLPRLARYFALASWVRSCVFPRRAEEIVVTARR